MHANNKLTIFNEPQVFISAKNIRYTPEALKTALVAM
jgi:hypothetical protein